MLAITAELKKGHGVPVDFRQQILDRLDRLGMTKYQLSELLNNKPSRNALYTYLRGESDMGGENLARVLEALDTQEKRKK